jgi:peptidoglycan/xylan/chitin deacetylase (PgdA/CDA1 family)
MLSRRQIVAGVAALSGLPLVPATARAELPRDTPGLAAQPDGVGGAGLTVSRMRTARPVIALTFDDGPHPTLTPRLLDILAQRKVRATFFVIGNRVPPHAGLVRRIAAEGHEIGNHSWAHPDLSRLGDDALFDQIDRAAGAVGDAVGRAPVVMRPPYGLLSARQRRLVHETRRLPTVLWSVDPEDWRRPSPATLTARIVAASEPGAVILAHDIVAPTVAAMPDTLDRLIAGGYGFVTVSELIGWPRWNRLRPREYRAS